jgi:hypothetical protein
MTNKRLYLVSGSTAIRTSRRRGWCSYIELLGSPHLSFWPSRRLAPLIIAPCAARIVTRWHGQDMMAVAAAHACRTAES